MKRQTTTGVPGSDEELIQRVRRRDFSAWNALFGRYRARAVSFAARMVGNGIDAEELAKGAFLWVIGEADRFSPNRPFKVWFFSILRKLVIEHVQRNHPEPRANLGKVAEAGLVEGDAPVSRLEEASSLYEALNRLKPVYRETLYLRTYERMGEEEIAEITGEKPPSVRNRLNYALERLHRGIA